MAVMLHYKVFPIFLPDGLMNNNEFILLIISMLFIASGGYIYNDLYDIQIDVINKNKSPWALDYSPRYLMYVYSLLTIAGILASIILGYSRGNPGILLWPGVSSLLLYGYARNWKKKLIWKNLLVSLLLTFPILYTAYADGLSLQDVISNDGLFYSLMRYYILLAFMLNITRELVKDIIDYKGDKADSVDTIPVVTGISKSFQIVQVLIWINIIIILYFNALFSTSYSIFIYIQYAIAFLLSFISFLGKFIPEHKYAIVLSDTLKIIMLAGIISLFFIK
jgi:4-hydroxybenzoate polyprenyltransferase